MSIAASAVLPSLPSLPISGLRKPAAQVPARKWPFPPEPQPAASLGDVRQMSADQIVSRKAMLLDVLMVAAWGIAIPAVLWLGAAAGF